MNTTKQNESVLKQVAVVRMGDYELKLTEEDLEILWKAHEDGDANEEPDFLEMIMDYMINIGTDNDREAAVVLAHLGVLQRAKVLYRRLNELNIIRRKESVR